jgi:putative peptidoglycan lipid II flippase
LVIALPPKPQRSLASIATIVAIATLVSKFAGLLRETAIAAEFGVGAEVDAYNYAYLIPGFLFILLGGINGPFHSSIISVLAKRPQEEAAQLVETINTLVGGLLLIMAVVMIVFADPIITIVAPGAPAAVHAIAVDQFRIMAPLGVLSGLIGIGFGTLNASDQYWLPSISPLLSSITVIIGAVFFADQFGPVVLAWGTLAGGFLQWFAQIPAAWKSGMGTLRLRFDFNQPGVRELYKVMGPATLSSGMLFFSLYISITFASRLPVGAPSALRFAQLLFLMPLGVLSNIILVPYMPIFAKLAAPENWPELKDRVRQSLVLTAMSMMPIGALMSALALPVVRLIYERKAFDVNASGLVASLLLVYGVGMFFYLGRDVLVRVFYGLGDGQTPLNITMMGLGFNALFCFAFTETFGAQGLAMATVGVNIISMFALMAILHRRIGGLPWRAIGAPILGLAAGSIITGLMAWLVSQRYEQIIPTDGFWTHVGEMLVGGIVGMAIFVAFIWQLKLPEMNFFVDRLRQKIPGLKPKQ